MSGSTYLTPDQFRDYMNWSVDLALRSACTQVKVPDAWFANQEQLATLLNQLAPRLSAFWDLFRKTTNAWAEQVAKNARGELGLSAMEWEARNAALHADLNIARENFIKAMDEEVKRATEN